MNNDGSEIHAIHVVLTTNGKEWRGTFEEWVEFNRAFLTLAEINKIGAAILAGDKWHGGRETAMNFTLERDEEFPPGVPNLIFGDQSAIEVGPFETAEHAVKRLFRSGTERGYTVNGVMRAGDLEVIEIVRAHEYFRLTWILGVLDSIVRVSEDGTTRLTWQKAS